MAEQIRCPHCGQTWDISSEQARQYAGQTITCTNCQQAFAVPGTVYAIPAAQAASPGVPSPAYAAQTFAYASPMPGPMRTSGFAVASLVLGIIGLIVPLVPGILAIVFGVMGIRRTRDPSVGGRGLAIAGLSVGAASILLSGCMLSILFPSLN